MVDPTLSKRAIAKADKPGTRRKPNPDHLPIPDMTRILASYVEEYRYNVAAQKGERR